MHYSSSFLSTICTAENMPKCGFSLTRIFLYSGVFYAVYNINKIWYRIKQLAGKNKSKKGMFSRILLINDVYQIGETWKYFQVSLPVKRLTTVYMRRDTLPEWDISLVRDFSILANLTFQKQIIYIRINSTHLQPFA